MCFGGATAPATSNVALEGVRRLLTSSTNAVGTPLVGERAPESAFRPSSEQGIKGDLQNVSAPLLRRWKLAYRRAQRKR